MKINKVLLLTILSGNLLSQGNQTIDLTKEQYFNHFVTLSAINKVLDLDTLPETLSIIVANPAIPYIEFQINKGPDSISLKRNCKTDQNCLNLLPSDFINSVITLTFTDSTLIGIGSRTLENPVRIILQDKKPYINIRHKEINLDKPCNDIPYDTRRIGPVPPAVAEFYRNIFLCTKPDFSTSNNCGKEVPFRYDYTYIPPYHSNGLRALSARYQVIYDQRRFPEAISYLKIKHKCGVEYNKVVKGPLRPKANSELIISVIGPKDTQYKIGTSSVQRFMEHQADFENALLAQGEKSSQKTSDSIISLSSEENNEVKVKAELSSLNEDLAVFNLMYPASSIVDNQYLQDLLCIQHKISQHFSIPMPATADQLASDLANYLISQNIESYYAHELCLIIQDIRARYQIAISKESRYYLSSESVQVENTDEFKISVKSEKDIPVFERNFNVRGGFKIDFSTGLFFTGHNSGDFIVSSESFRYIDSRDSVLSNGMDTLLYTGEILDTSLNVIRRNKNITFGTGAYMHFYRRTGTWFDYGGSAGIIVNNNAQVQILLGLSIMVKAGNNRIALVGGLATGKEKTLSEENSQYYLKDYPVLISNRNEIPKAYTGTNPATFEKWKISWFAGITFNFASKTPGEK